MPGSAVIAAAQGQDNHRRQVKRGDNTPRDPSNKVGAILASQGARYDSQFFKTKLCTFWQSGRCTRRFCKYAHGEEELQKSPDLAKTAMCRAVLNSGECRDPRCRYAHDLDELRATDSFYKTTMCCFHRYGACKLGDQCRHAHSRSELRPNVDMPLQKYIDTVNDEWALEVEGAAGKWARAETMPAKCDTNQALDRAAPPPPFLRAISEVAPDWEQPQQGSPADAWAQMHSMPAQCHLNGSVQHSAPLAAPAPYADVHNETTNDFAERLVSTAAPYYEPALQPRPFDRSVSEHAQPHDDDLETVGEWARMQTMPASPYAPQTRTALLPAVLRAAAPAPTYAGSAHCPSQPANSGERGVAAFPPRQHHGVQPVLFVRACTDQGMLEHDMPWERAHTLPVPAQKAMRNGYSAGHGLVRVPYVPVALVPMPATGAAGAPPGAMVPAATALASEGVVAAAHAAQQVPRPPQHQQSQPQQQSQQQQQQAPQPQPQPQQPQAQAQAQAQVQLGSRPSAVPACLAPGLVGSAGDPEAAEAYMRSMEARMLAAAMPEHYED